MNKNCDMVGLLLDFTGCEVPTGINERGQKMNKSREYAYVKLPRYGKKKRKVKVKILARAGKYLMVRWPKCMPFVVTEDDLVDNEGNEDNEAENE